jgi:RNA polymerase sigma factor (sigma-70 family)
LGGATVSALLSLEPRASPPHNPRTLPDPAVDPYTTHADTIESALAHTCRVHRLAPDAADEFASWARIRLLDKDQAILRKFEGRSRLRTFLTTVVQRLYLDWRNAEWGKWRPTADARRLGSVAIELERLVLRDQLSYEEAVQTLVGRELATAEGCEQVWVQLPRRPRRRRVDEEYMASVPGTSSASEAVDEDESRAEASAMSAALARALDALAPADRTLLQLRYWAGHTVARIAAITGENQRALYRRFDRLTAELRRSLEAAGVSGRALAALEGRFEEADSGDVAAELTMGNAPLGPSPRRSTGGEHA